MRKRMSGRVWAGLALVGVGFVCAATGQAAEPPPCATGTYQSDEPPLLPAGGARIAMRDGMIHLQGCSPAAVTLRAKKKRVRVKAAWDAEQCPGIGKVRLKARADNTCTTMRGVVKAKRYRKRFVAGAVSPVPPPTVDLDSGIVPAVTQVAGFDGNPPRPVAAITDQSGILLHFVENELIVVSDNTAAVGTFAASIGGSVVRSFMPTDFGLPGPAQHLVRFDPASADGSALAADLQAIDPTASGALRVSSAAGLGTLATAAAGATGGVIVAPNVVMTPHAYFDRRTTENGSLPVCPGPPRTNGPNCVPDGIPNPAGAPEAFNQDAYQWSYMRQGGTQNIAVGEAWRALWLSQRLTAGSVKLAFIDGGFSDSNDHPDGWEHHTNSIHADGLSENDLECTGGLSCPWHGTNAVSAAMAVPDDMIGAAGPAGPIAKPVTIRMSGDVFNYLGAWGIAFTSGARILNMSFGARVPAAVSFVLVPLEVATEAARDGGMLLLASAGNDGQDVDAEDCAPPFDWPCWEEAWWAPCENAGVTCIGALAGNATTLMSTVDNNGQVVPVSNWGGENVELFGPGILWVGEDPNDPEPHRFTATSAAAPFVATVPFEEGLKRYDRDGDGFVGRAEVSGTDPMDKVLAPSYGFDAFDLGRDGKLDAKDWEVFRRMMASENGLLAIRLGGTGDMTDTAVRWRVDRPGVISGYSTPTVYEPPDRPKQVVIPESFQLSSYSVADGSRVWWVRGLPCEMKSVASYDREHLYVNGWGFPQNQPGRQVATVSFEEGLTRYDRDGDGFVARTEITDTDPMDKVLAPSYSYDAFDLDCDGRLDAKEWERPFGAGPERRQRHPLLDPIPHPTERSRLTWT